MRITGQHEEVKFLLAVSPNQPLFKLRWTQDATPSTPSLSISKIHVMGFGTSTDNCQLNQEILFDIDG